MSCTCSFSSINKDLFIIFHIILCTIIIAVCCTSHCAFACEAVKNILIYNFLIAVSWIKMFLTITILLPTCRGRFLLASSEAFYMNSQIRYEMVVVFRNVVLLYIMNTQ